MEDVITDPANAKKFLFLIGWVSGSDSACGDITDINDQNDLIPEFRRGNEHVFAVVLIAPNDNIAAIGGYKESFFEGYTAHDTVSVVEALDPNEKTHHKIKIVDLYTGHHTYSTLPLP
jgi:hypothetical protein